MSEYSGQPLRDLLQNGAIIIWVSSDDEYAATFLGRSDGTGLLELWKQKTPGSWWPQITVFDVVWSKAIAVAQEKAGFFRTVGALHRICGD